MKDHLIILNQMKKFWIIIGNASIIDQYADFFFWR